MPQVLLRVYFMDDSHKTVYVDPAITTIERLWEIVSEKMLLSPDSAECFFIWQISKEMEVLLYAEQTVQDAYDDWDTLLEKYGTKRSLTSDLKAVVSSAVVSKPGMERSPTKINLQRSKTSNTLRQTPSLTKSTSSKNSSPTTLARSTSRVGPLEDAEVEAFKFVFRPTSVLPLSIEHNLVQPEAVHLLYVQAVHHVVNSNYPCLQQTAIILAGVQLQIQLGDQKPEHLEHVKEALDNYIPEHLRDKRKPEEWASDVLNAHRLHKGKDTFALKKAYLEVVQQWPFYGCTFFRVKGVPSQTSFFKQDYQGTVVVGINHFGIHMIHPRALKFETWKFQDLVYWDSTPTSFGFEVITGVKQEPTRSYTLKTLQAELINDLMHDWSEEWQAQFRGLRPLRAKSGHPNIRTSSGAGAGYQKSGPGLGPSSSPGSS